LTAADIEAIIYLNSIFLKILFLSKLINSIAMRFYLVL